MAMQLQNSAKCTVAVGLKDPLLNGCKRRLEIDRVGLRDVGEASGGGGWLWVAAQRVVEDHKYPNWKWGWMCFTGDRLKLGLGPLGC